MAQTDLVAVTGHMWNNLPAEVKKKFDDEYQRDKERYDAELAEFYRKNPHEKKSKKQLLREKQSAINAQKKWKWLIIPYLTKLKEMTSRTRFKIYNSLNSQIVWLYFICWLVFFVYS